MIFNNKGNPVRKYEPFFSSTNAFEFASAIGVSSVLFYDPPGRVAATLHPDNSWEKTVFDCWRQSAWDGNDTVLISDPRVDPDVGDYFTRLLGTAPGAFTSWYDARIGGTFGTTPVDQAAQKDAATKAEAHAGTPSVKHFDALGRTCLTVDDNGGANRYGTRLALDTQSKPLAVFDAFGRRAIEHCLRLPQTAGGFQYIAGTDLAGNAIYWNGMDGGERRALANVMGKRIGLWDARGQTFTIAYDALQRPIQRYVGKTLLELSIYGEGLAAQNLCGRLFRHYDGAGWFTTSNLTSKATSSQLTGGLQSSTIIRSTGRPWQT